jgi:hypothetical protein
MDLGTKVYVGLLIIGHLSVALMLVRLGIDLHRERKYYDRERERYRQRRAKREAE